MFLSFLAFVSSLTALETPPAAQDYGKGMEIHIEREFDVPAEQVWDALAHDYVGIDHWASIVVASTEMQVEDLPEGFSYDPEAPVVGRIVTTGFGEVSETLTMYDEDAMQLTFRGGNLPGMIAYTQNTHTVTDLGNNRSLLTFDIYMVPNGPAKLMKRKLRNRFQENLGHHMEELEVYLLTGEPAVAAP
jgi:hypothetical protein